MADRRRDAIRWTCQSKVCDICTDIVCDIVPYIICSIISLQDCVCLIVPYPNNPNPPETFNIATDFDMSGNCLLWYGRLQLLFRCTLCPAGAFHDTRRHTEVSLAFFSTFEPVNLTSDSAMQREGVPMFYDSASSSALPSLYICPVKDVLGRVPLIPCFVEGNTSPTIPHQFGRIGPGERPRTRGQTPETAAACTNSIRGCGAMDGGRSARSRS